MNVFKRISAIALVFSLVSSFGLTVQPAQSFRTDNPKDVYHEAWKLVRDNYYDESFNGVQWREYEHKFDSKIKSTEDAHKYIAQMLKALNDPYTRFLDPRAFQDENDAIDAKIVGIGISLQQSKDKQPKLSIVRTIEDGPAEKAGVKAGDELIAIDGESSVGITPEQAANRIRGAAGTPVDLTVKRTEKEIRKVTIVRKEIIIKAVRAKMIDGSNIGMIQLNTFISNDAAKEFRGALRKLSRADGLIIDLRGNPGGLLSNALEIADMLLENGAIVSTISRHGKHTDVATGLPLSKQPIAVLMDADSASASEILASALHDNNRAVLVGTKTYGKGLVQEINKLPGGAAVHITVSRYLTPNNLDINKVGVKPDRVVEDKDAQVTAALSVLKDKIASLKKQLHATSSLPVSQ